MVETFSLPSWSIAAIGGVGGVIAYAMIRGKLPLPKFMRMSINELVEKQIIEDEFDGSALMTWIKRNRPSGEIKVLVVKPTPFWIKKLNLKDAENIDAEKNLIGCMIDAEGKFLKMQLFSFSSISQTMLQKFDVTGEMVVTS